MASIKKRPDGKWRARYRDEAGREHARHFDRKVDAQRWLDEVTTSVVTGTYVDPRAGRTTFETFYREWAASQVWEATTARAMDLAAGSATFAALPLSRVRPSHVEAWVKAMQSQGLAASTIRTRFNNVRSVLRAAVRDRALASDPTVGVSLPRVRRREAAMAVPSPSDVGRLLAASEDFRAFIGLCAFAGLRLGEAAALRVDDVDFLRRTIRVERQVQRANGGHVELRPPKYGSERTIYAPDGLLELLSQHVAGYLHGMTGWLYPGKGGAPWHQNTVGHHWRKVRAAAGLEGLHLHTLRHFYASGLIADGCDVVTVQRALGHKSATVTLNTYSHLWPTAEDRTRKAAQGLVMGALADSLRTQAAFSAADQGG
jgi:integrase